MRIKKTFQGNLPENKIVNMQSDSQTDAYACAYANLIAYPVGSIYISDNSTSPASLFGGTWERLNGYYPYFGNGYNKTTYTGKNTQGHKLTANQSGLREHNHQLGPRIMVWDEGKNGATSNVTWSGAIQYYSYGDLWTNTRGGSDWGAIDAHSHNIATVELYAWRRTA